MQASADRLWMLPHICRRWGGAMVIVSLGVPEAEWPQMAAAVAAGRDGSTDSADGCAITRLSLTQPADDVSNGYPINWMRNRGISCVKTSHYFVVDVDFWPSVELRESVEAQIDGWGERKRALVVPNFQRNGHGCRNDANHAACREAYEGHSTTNKLSMPETFSELLECERNTECIVFDGEYNPTGQSSTDIRAWRKLGGGEAMAVTCLKSGRYEPFVVLRKSDETPTFDERFHGYGKNKVQLPSTSASPASASRSSARATSSTSPTRSRRRRTAGSTRRRTSRSSASSPSGCAR